MVSPLADILSLEKLDANLFRSLHHCENFRKILYGGQVLGQALMAAYNSQDGDLPNSLHAYFIHAGSSEMPVIYDVENVRDGRSFSSRRAVARQFGRPIFNMSASFHKPEPGVEHQVPFPKDIKHPEELLAERGKQKRPTDNNGNLMPSMQIEPFEFVAVDQALFSTDVIDPPVGYFWIKATEKLPDDPIVQYCALAFASDYGLLATALLPHKTNIFDKSIMAASIDHAMWFHRTDFRVDEWLLCQTFSPWAGNARGFTHGSIFNMQGQLIASTAQEGLLRQI